MQHSLGPNPDSARMLHTSVGKSNTAEAGARSRMHHWKCNFTFPPQEWRTMKKQQYINIIFSWVWLSRYLHPLLKNLAIGSRHMGPDAKPFVINRSLFFHWLQWILDQAQERQDFTAVRVTHILLIEKKKKRNNTKHLRCQSLQHSFVCVLLF